MFAHDFAACARFLGPPLVLAACCALPARSGRARFAPPQQAADAARVALAVALGLAWLRASAFDAPSSTVDLIFVLVLALLAAQRSKASQRLWTEASWVSYAGAAAMLLLFGLGDAFGKLCLAPVVAWLFFEASVFQANA